MILNEIDIPENAFLPLSLEVEQQETIAPNKCKFYYISLEEYVKDGTISDIYSIILQITKVTNQPLILY